MKLGIYKIKIRLWERYEQDKKRAEKSGKTAPPLPVHNGVVIKKKPRKPGNNVLESPVVQCTGSTAIAVVDLQRPLDSVEHVFNGPINGTVGGAEDKAMTSGVNHCCDLQIVV